MAKRENGTSESNTGEDRLIADYFRPLAHGFPGSNDLRDDAAAIEPPEGCDLVITTDALVSGVHFFADGDPADIAFKAVAVNISDLAAKAADPIVYSLALVLPRGTQEGWLAGFAKGLGEAQAAFGIAMSGGDTTASPSGPLMISITAFGSVPRGRMMLRSGASAGEALYVSGTIGDAGLALFLDQDRGRSWPIAEADRRALLSRYWRPEPRLALRDALLGHASAAMDISDGLAIDCTRLCKTSGVTAQIDGASVPLSAAASALLKFDPVLLETILTGGDDYEILAAVPPSAEVRFRQSAAAAGVPVARIGSFGEGVGRPQIRDANGAPLILAHLGYDHFAN